MEQLEQLYDLYISNGLLSSEAASLEEFSNASREQQALLFQLGSDAGLFGTTTFEQFGSAFQKKKDIPEPVMVSPSESGSLAQQPPRVSKTPEQILADPSISDEDARRYLGVEAVKAQQERDENRPLDIITTASELQTYDFDQLLPYEQVKVEQLAAKYKTTPQEWLKEVEAKRDEVTDESQLKAFMNRFAKGDRTLGEMLVSLPGTVYTAAATFTDPLFKKISGKEAPPIEDRVAKINEFIGADTLLESLIKEQEYRGKKAELYDREQNVEGGIFENFKKGNVNDGFIQLGNTLFESAPVTLGIMMSSLSGVGLARTAAGATTAMTGTELRAQREENPEQSDFKTLTKAVGLAAAEMVFTTITSGTLGKVYKDIIFKEGVKVGSQTFRKGLIGMYETALKKLGPITQGMAEGIEEVATQVTQNAINGRPIYEGVPDAFIAGFGGGGVYASPIAVNNGRKLINEAVAETKINKILKPTEFNNITTAFENPTIGDLQFDLSKVKRSDVILDKELKKEWSRVK